ncbi:MAG: nitronate monooxygenase [Rhizobiales bacterium]|nr:nitronate monooxygenase [Hyphomicrobiales bacterium]
MAIATSVTRLLGITHPIILAPMGGVAGGRLAAAVTAAGGLGIIGGGYGNPKAGYGGHEFMEREFRAAGNAPIGIGYITWSLAQFPELLDQALDRKPIAVFLSFGDEKQFAGKIKAAGSLLICQVQDVEGARRAADAGADIIVAQGTEAGGHGAQKRATFALVPAVVDAVHPIPILAAGGIADGRGLAAALMLGASGALIGTRLWATPEALGHNNVKELLLKSSGDTTMRTRIFDIIRELDWPEGYSGRALANEFTAAWHGREAELASRIDAEKERFWSAMREGDVSTAVVFAGEGLDLIHDIRPAGEIVREIAADAEALLRKPSHFSFP